jgi:DNA processing protein
MPPKNITINNISKENLEFPSLLKEIPDCPDSLFFKGVLPTDSLCIAIVGTRKASNLGLSLAYDISTKLVKAGFIIVSGLAYGIDASAHKGAVDAKGKTIAVLACGLNTIYPKSHTTLSEQVIKNGGAVISEYPLDASPLAHQFLARNRIISGLSIATIIIESPIRSGARTTAKHATEQGREVLVIPGNVNDQRYGGSHELIRNGARLVSGIDDILHDLASLSAQYPKLIDMTKLDKDKEHSTKDMSKDELIIFEVLRNSTTPLTIDTMIELTKLEAHRVSQSLTFLTVSGIVKDGGGKFFIS